MAHEALLSLKFSRQEYWSEWPFPLSGDLPDPGIKPRSLALHEDSLPSEPPEKPIYISISLSISISSVQSLSHVQLFVTPWTVAHQAPLFMGILQTRILEWVAMPSSRGSSKPRDQTQVSCIAGGFFTVWATREAKNTGVVSPSLLQGIFPTQELNQGLLLCRWILYQLSYLGSPSISMCYVLISLVMSDSLRPYGLTLPGFSVCGILQTRILEWVSMLSRVSSQPGIKPVSLMSSALVGGFFTTSATYTCIYVYIHIPIHIYILPEISGPVFCTRTPSTNCPEIIWYLLRAWYCARYILRYNGDCYIKPIIKQITVCAISKIASYKTSFIIFPHGWPSFQSSVFITWSFNNNTNLKKKKKSVFFGFALFCFLVCCFLPQIWSIP